MFPVALPLFQRLNTLFFFPQANANYNIVNKNFCEVQKKNRKISSFVSNINQDFSKLTSNEMKLEQVEYGSLYHSHMIESEQLYIAKMTNIDNNLFPPNKLDLKMSLLSNNQHCRNLHCYQHTHFSLEKDQLTVKTEKVDIKLTPYVHVSCILLKKDRTSLFHNEIFRQNKEWLISTNPSLPNLTLSDLYSQKIDTLTTKN